jgi:hypothetical protein
LIRLVLRPYRCIDCSRRSFKYSWIPARKPPAKLPAPTL